MSAQPSAVVPLRVPRWAPVAPSPELVRVMHARDQAAEAAQREHDLGPEPRGYAAGVASALAWVLGEGPQPDGPAWCGPCSGTGDGPRGRECGACAGRGLEP